MLRSRRDPMAELDSPAAVRFGVFEFDPATGDLSKAGRRIRLQDQPGQVLALLVARHGSVVTRDELRNQLWRDDTFVDFDTGLNVVITKLRQALGDSATSPRFIETIPKKGYRFIAPVLPAAGRAAPAPAHAPRRVPRHATTIAVMALLLASAAGIWIWRTPLPPTPIRTLAVLPLENLSGTATDDYFTEGITDALITDLASIHALNVIARQSTKQYKGSSKPVSAIARELGGVDAVVEGSVLRTDTRVRLIVQLIDARTDRHLWARTYEQDLRDVLQLQREAARTIAAEIRAALTPAERARLGEARSVNPAAHDAYLRGRYLLDGRPEEEANSLEALAQFERAIELDPEFAPAYVGVALVQERRGSTLGGRPPLETRPLAFRAARRAIALDEDNAEAYDVLARLQMSEFDWPGADRSFARMFELSPATPRGLIWYSYRLLLQDRYAEAVDAARRAEALDRLNLNTRVMVGFVLTFGREYELAIRNFQEVLALAPGHLNARSFLIGSLASVGRHDEAIAQADALVERFGRRPLTLPRLAFAHGRAGHRDDAERAISELIRLSRREYVSPGQIAIAYAGLGDRDRTFEWLEHAYDERAVMMIFFPIEPMFQWPDDPRYGRLVKKIRQPHAARESP